MLPVTTVFTIPIFSTITQILRNRWEKASKKGANEHNWHFKKPRISVCLCILFYALQKIN